MRVGVGLFDLPTYYFIAYGYGICFNACLVLVPENAKRLIIFFAKEQITESFKVVLKILTELCLEFIPIRFDHENYFQDIQIYALNCLDLISYISEGKSKR